jgi:hypothetical protein
MSAAPDSARPLLDQLLEQQPPNAVSTKQPEQQLSRFERFGHFATIFGFINDALNLPFAVIAVVSILLATTGGNSATVVFTNIHLNAWHALMIWFLGAYSYVVFLHSYWAKHYSTDRKSFFDFLLQDIFTKSGKPILLLPLIACIILFIWIAVEVTILAPALIILWAAAFIFGIPTVIVYSTEYYEKLKRKTAPSSEFRKDVDTNWAQWDKRVKLELSRNIIVSSNKFKDSLELWHITPEDFNYVLVKYASLHADRAKYGTVETYKSDERTIAVTFPNALILTKYLQPGKISIH